MAWSIQPDPHITSVNGFNRDRYRILPCADDNRLPPLLFVSRPAYVNLQQGLCYKLHDLFRDDFFICPHKNDSFYSGTSLSVVLVSDGYTCVKYGMQYNPFVSQPKCSIFECLFRAATKTLIPFGTCITWVFLKRFRKRG